MRKISHILGIAILSLLFLSVPLLSSQVMRAGAGGEIHPATYHYNYRYYRPVHEREAGSRQCFWYYTNGAYVYVCR